MKKPQRSFVVEIKQSRRPTPASKSIWGDTDLKALAQAVEHDIPALFPAGQVQKSPETKASITSSPALQAQRPRAGVSDDEASTPNQRSTSSRSSSLEQEATSAGKAKSQPRARIERAKASRKDAKRRPDLTAATSPQDELLALERENQELKRQMSEMYRAQNNQLREMLRRFETPFHVSSRHR